MNRMELISRIRFYEEQINKTDSNIRKQQLARCVGKLKRDLRLYDKLRGANE